MQGFWRVTIVYVNIRVINTLNTVVHSRTWSNFMVTDRYKCKHGLYVECRVQILSQYGVKNDIVFTKALCVPCPIKVPIFIVAYY